MVLMTAGFVLGGCAGGDTTDPLDDRPVVLATFTVLADIAAEVAGPYLAVESLTKPGAEIHDYEPTPGDIKKASQAQLIIDNGLGLERWFARFVADLDVPHVVATDGLEPIDIAGDVDAGKPNPHAWMSPLNVQTYVANIVAAFSELDHGHAAEFAANGAAYSDKLQQVHDDMLASLAVVPPTRRALVTCEGAFSYLARDAGLAEQYLWPVNAESDATPRSIASVIDYVQENRVPAVFCESTVSDRAMRQVVQVTDADFGGILYVDSLSLPDGPVPTYLDLIRHDADTIVQALTGDSGTAVARDGGDT